MSLFRVVDKTNNTNRSVIVTLKGTFKSRLGVLHEVVEVGTNRRFTVKPEKLQDVA